jgi:uncharacterized protein YbbC (DUF1343 family)
MQHIILRTLCILMILAQNIAFGHDIKTGAQQTDLYFNLLKDKNVGIIVNQSSLIGNTHLLDTLLSAGINVKKIFSPEHGFRGNHGAGDKVNSSLDEKTGLPIVSLYGNHKKPTAVDLTGLDYIVFDIQDVGVRYYTYTSTMHYAMEACSENKVPFMVLDRPNPNGYFVDGPILDMKYKSFIGMHPVPIVHGLTVGEYAKMINGEKWLKDRAVCDLKVIPMTDYNHHMEYELPVKPSPNLPNITSIYLYPSLCLFEGTPLSIGRGTDKPFQCLGSPDLKHGSYFFTPKPIPGVVSSPKFNGKKCQGYLLETFGSSYIPVHKRIYLNWIILVYEQTQNKETFFLENFNLLAGNSKLQEQIKNGKSQEEIYASWNKGVKEFKEMRKKYLIYSYWEKVGLIKGN